MIIDRSTLLTISLDSVIYFLQHKEADENGKQLFYTKQTDGVEYLFFYTTEDEMEMLQEVVGEKEKTTVVCAEACQSGFLYFVMLNIEEWSFQHFALEI